MTNFLIYGILNELSEALADPANSEYNVTRKKKKKKDL